jgi:protein-S-isoprenylcysteine O-methyltransferase Ste14
VVGLFGLTAWGLLYRFRVPREEQLMLTAFEEEYAAYMQRTGRIVPKFRFCT